MARICAAAGCDKPAHARRLCPGHYKTLWHATGGTLTPRPRPPTPLPDWLDLDRLAAVDTADRGWETRKACGDQPIHVFFPPTPGRGGGGYDYRLAEPICARCPVRHECLAAYLPSIAYEPDRQSGCYIGGTTPAQRTTIRRRRSAA